MGSDLKITSQLQDYILNKGLELHPIQKEIIEYNSSLGEIKKMQISVSQCQLIHLIIKISNIKNVLEIGTFTGLSTLSMALALPDDGKILALDKDKETNKIAIDFFKKAKQDKKIKTIVKPALETLEEIKGQYFDLIFIDADKMNYKEYYEKSLGLLKEKGLIIIDNVLWYGEVVGNNNNEKFTENIKEFNNYVFVDQRVEKIIVPFGDGMTVCRKI